MLPTHALLPVRPAGAKFSLKDIHAAVKEDEELMEALKDPELMAEYREFFDSEKAEQKVAAVRVSKSSQAKTAASKLNHFQQEACCLIFSSL